VSVTRRIDLLRSWVRSAAKASAERVSRMAPVAGARQAFEELRQRRASLSEAALSTALAHAPGVAESTVSIAAGRVRIDLGYEDGSSLVFATMPASVRFAPRGAKEVFFSVEPPELAGDRRVREAVGCVAAAIARALWGPVLPRRKDEEMALVDRDAVGLRADLRSVPAVRSALEGGALAMALDVLTIESFAAEDRALRIKIGLPLPPI
jgi:hypothetical protein